MDAMDVLRQIVQSQMSTTPFRHKPSQKNLLYYSKLLSQVKFDNNILSSDQKDESDDEDDDSEEDKNEENDEVTYSDDCMDLINLDTQVSDLYNILHSTILGEGNTSILLIGRPAFGKSSLLSIVMNEIQNEHGKNAFIYIYLNGNIHTTDIEALYEVVQQLALKYGKQFNFSLNDNNDVDSEIDIKLKKSGFVDNLQFLVDELKKVTMENYDFSSNKKPVYIILDNFELFAKRRKQTLLYNLFDLNQSESSLINIIGITKQKSVYEALEKRIRSRFVHTKIFVPEKDFLSTKSFRLFYKIIYNAFIINDYQKFYNNVDVNKRENIRKFIKKYNYWIAAQLLENKLFETYIRTLHSIGESPARLMIISGLISAVIFDKKYFFKKIDHSVIKYIISEIENQLFTDPFLRMINDLTVNELIILVIAAKLNVTKHDKFNFEMIYQTLQNVQKSDSMMMPAGKVQYFQCYKELIDLKFLVPLTYQNVNSNNVGQNMHRIYNRRYIMVKFNKLIECGDDILRYIAQNVKALPAWINSWLVNNKTHICL